MPPSNALSPAPVCRTAGCSGTATDQALRLCRHCLDAYRSQLALKDLLTLRLAQEIESTYPDLVARLTPRLVERLMPHAAAHAQLDALEGRRPLQEGLEEGAALGWLERAVDDARAEHLEALAAAGARSCEGRQR